MKPKHIISAIAFILMLFFTIASASALTFSNAKFVSQAGSTGFFGDSSSYAQFDVDLQNNGQNTASGLIELALIPGSSTAGFSIVTSQSACDENSPWNVHRSYFLFPGESVHITLKTTYIKDGKWRPVVTNANGCYNIYGVDWKPQQPFGSEMPVNRIAGIQITAPNAYSTDPLGIIFGDPSGNNQMKCLGSYDALKYIQKTKPNCMQATCVTGIPTCVVYGSCNEGAQKSVTCPDGKTISTDKCVNAQWQPTEEKCVGTTTTIPPSQDNPSVMGPAMLVLLLLIGIIMLAFGIFRMNVIIIGIGALLSTASIILLGML
jgi:hypothetical protein